jgi:hypothetical protein
LFVRFEEPRSQPLPEAPPPGSEAQPVDGDGFAETNSRDEVAVGRVTVPEPAQVPPITAQKIWLFEDLILEEPRSREAENQDSRHRFDFPPYERFF